MPDAPWTAWLKVGRVLPRGIRERVFEPAVYDLVAQRLGRRSEGLSRRSAREPLGLLIAWTLLESLGVGVTGVFLRGRKPTRASWVLLGSAAVVVLLAVMRASYPTP